jgi:hypothetical protein
MVGWGWLGSHYRSHDDEVSGPDITPARAAINPLHRGGLPPTIIFAMYQADSVAKILGTLGYLSAIGTQLSPNIEGLYDF